MNQLIIGVLVGAGVAVTLFLVFRKRFEASSEDSKEAMLSYIKGLMPEILSQSQDELLKRANEKLGETTKLTQKDLESKRAEIERMVKSVKDDLRVNQERLNKSDKERVGSYKELMAQIDEQRKLTDQLKVSTESLKNVLSNNQMRGQFGEQVAEELMQMAGFVKGQHYAYNVSQQTRDTRPDFTIYLPDQTKINVDVKFPYKNLQNATQTDDPVEKKKYLKIFEQDVKQKIKDVKGRDYINPSENTVDFAIIFIPNEMIFSYIYDKLNDVWTEAMKGKIVFAGPFSFTAILRMVWQAYENFRFQSNIQEIVGNIKEVELEFGKFFESFEKIGDRITSLDKQYNEVVGTRANVLRKKLDKVKVEQVEAPEQAKLLPDVED